MTLLPLQSGILYGPVNSRRLGKSLGINLMPGSYKLCSFNCVYCHYGWTRKQGVDFKKYSTDLPTIDQVAESVAHALKSSLEFKFLTFSGNGEPTLYPQFATLVEEVVSLRNKYRPKVKIALLSNSTGLARENVLHSLVKIDFAVFLIASLVSRSARFFLVGGLIYLCGPRIQVFIDRYFNLLAVALTVLVVAGFACIRYLL